MSFRDKLEATLRSVAPLLEVPGVVVGGSEVPNLLQPGAASTLVVSEDVDLVIPVSSHRAVCDLLPRLVGLHPSPDEPSVWLPDDDDRLIEVNFIGQDPAIVDPADTYLLDAPGLPLMVFGPLTRKSHSKGRIGRPDLVKAELPHTVKPDPGASRCTQTVPQDRSSSKGLAHVASRRRSTAAR